MWLRWPSVMAIFLFFLNVDYVIMPFLTGIGISGWSLFWAAAWCATGEVVYWNWYSKWLVRNAKTTERYRRVAREFSRQGLHSQFTVALESSREFLADAWEWFVQRSLEHERVQEPLKNQMLKGADSFIRGTHTFMTYPLMLGLGLCPSGWAVGIVLERLRPVPGAFAILLAANACKTYLLGRIYLWLPGWAKVALLVIVAGLLVWSIRKTVRKVRQITPA